MLVVRAIRPQDFDGLMALARLVGDGMTTLKADENLLCARIDLSCASFAGAVPREQGDYLFVMEDTATRQLVGVCGIKAAVGLKVPFYNYRLGTQVNANLDLGVFARMQTLYLSNDLTGCSELCSLFLHPDYRSGSNGRLLSKSRFLFIAQFPHLFDQKLIAELRGFLRDDGRSPFWESLGRHFFNMEFARADDLTGLGKKSFIAELMPRHPLYVAMLPADAQQAIGQVHVATAPARRLLEQEGMHYEGYVDIFDGGPVLQARVVELRALRESDVALAELPGAVTASPARLPPPALVSNTAMLDFRVVTTEARARNGHIELNEAVLASLACRPGDAVRSMPLNPKRGPHA